MVGGGFSDDSRPFSMTPSDTAILYAPLPASGSSIGGGSSLWMPLEALVAVSQSGDELLVSTKLSPTLTIENYFLLRPELN